MKYVQHPLIYFYNIKVKQLQYTSETSKTLETHMQHRGGENWASRFCLSGSEPVARRDMRAPLALPALMGALGSAWVRRDLTRHNTSASAAVAGLAACVTSMGDERIDGERASGIGVWDGHAARPAIGHGTAADERVVGEGVRMNERPCCCVGCQADKNERLGI
jgi:hypothetical protein